MKFCKDCGRFRRSWWSRLKAWWRSADWFLIGPYAPPRDRVAPTQYTYDTPIPDKFGNWKISDSKDFLWMSDKRPRKSESAPVGTITSKTVRYKLGKKKRGAKR